MFFKTTKYGERKGVNSKNANYFIFRNRFFFNIWWQGGGANLKNQNQNHFHKFGFSSFFQLTLHFPYVRTLVWLLFETLLIWAFQTPAVTYRLTWQRCRNVWSPNEWSALCSYYFHFILFSIATLRSLQSILQKGSILKASKHKVNFFIFLDPGRWDRQEVVWTPYLRG